MAMVALRSDIKASDRKAVESITRSSGFFTEEEVDIALEVFDEFVDDEDSGYEYVFAELGLRTVGYAAWGLDEQTESSYELYWIAVDQDYRKEGIGKELLHHVEKSIAAKGPGQLFIETSGKEQYLPTRCFYERQGYKQAAWLDDYFAPGDARVIYAKRF